MKKSLAILLLIFGGAAGIALITLLTGIVCIIAAMMIPVGGEWALYVVLVGFVLLMGYPVNRLRELFKKQYDVFALVFLTCLCAPSVIASVIVLLTGTENPIELPGILGLIDVEKTFVFTTAVFTVGVVWRAIYAAIIEKRKKK